MRGKEKYILYINAPQRHTGDVCCNSEFHTIGSDLQTAFFHTAPLFDVYSVHSKLNEGSWLIKKNLVQHLFLKLCAKCKGVHCCASCNVTKFLFCSSSLHQTVSSLLTNTSTRTAAFIVVSRDLAWWASKQPTTYTAASWDTSWAAQASRSVASLRPPFSNFVGCSVNTAHWLILCREREGKGLRE